MPTNLPFENITWLQNGEPISGGVSGNSDGVLNRPLVQLHDNVDEVRDNLDATTAEVVAARDGEATLLNKINSLEDLINALGVSATAMNSESVAKINRDKFPSGFNIDVLKESLELQEVNAASIMGSGTNIPRNLITSGLGFPRIAGISTADSNKAYYMGSPKPLYAHGHPIKLEARPEYGASLVIAHPTAPSTGTRQEMAFVEIWKEEIKLGVADSVAFPYGNVNFENTKTGTYDTCTLLNTNASGGNYPAYLAASGTHGFYVKTDDANFLEFAKNPENNIIIDGDKIYQLLFRVRVVTAAPTSRHPWMDTTIKAQGKLASASAIAFNPNADDVGESFASDASLASDGKVYAYPLYIAHRRNSTVWSYANPNGAGSISSGVSGRPDGKFYDQISIDDVLDLRCHISLNNQHDVKDIYERTLNKILSCNLKTSWEGLNSDSDGNETYKALDIHATKLLRAEGVCGTDTFDASDEVIWAKKASNGISAEFDGFRSYFSDIGGDQTVTGLISNAGVDGVNPTNIFTYVASSRTLTIDATDLKSNAGLAQTARTKVSIRRPHLVWSAKRSGAASTENAPMVAGTWSGLGGDSASFVADNTSTVSIGDTWDLSTLVVGAVYTSPNGVSCTALERQAQNTAYFADFSFSGSTVPTVLGTWTKVSGTGPSTFVGTGTASLTLGYYRNLNNTLIYIGEGANLHSGHGIHVNAYFTFQSGSGFIARVPYQNEQSIKATHYKVQVGGVPTNILPNNGVGFIPFGNTVDPVNDGNVAQDTHTKSTSMMGFVYKDPVMGKSNPKVPDFVGAREGAFLKFGTNDYRGWYGAYDGDKYILVYATSTDGISWTKDYNKTLSGGKMADGLDALEISSPCVLLDGSTYKMWATIVDSSSIYHIAYLESTDFINWSIPILSLTGGNLAPYDSYMCDRPSVIKDGDLFKVLYAVLDSGNGSYRTMYAESTNGVSWTNFRIAFDITAGGAYSTKHLYNPCWMKDGLTYKAWLSAYDSTNVRILYSTSSDTITWTTPVLVIDKGLISAAVDGTYAYKPCVILDGSTYKIWYSVSGTQAVARTAYSTSSNGTTWLTPIISINIGGEVNGYQGGSSYTPSVINDAGTYKMWFTGYGTDNKGRILYSTSSDCITWSTPVLALNAGNEPNGYDSQRAEAPSVIKDGLTYKMWYSGYNNSNTRTLYTTSSDGITWATPVLVMNIGTEPNGYNTHNNFSQTVIKDGSTYKLWFAGANASVYRILYSTSSDGLTWSTPVLALNAGIDPHGYTATYSYLPHVIKDGSVYRMWVVGVANSRTRILQSISLDGINWSSTSLVVDFSSLLGFSPAQTYTPFVIKDGVSYRMWFSMSIGGYSKTFYATLALTDASNVGSSTTGVYTTPGPINCCPPADSQVVMFYEANAEQYPHSEVSGKSFKVYPALDIDKLYVTNYSTSASVDSTVTQRDVYATLFPAYSAILPYSVKSYLSLNLGNWAYGDAIVTGSAPEDYNTRFTHVPLVSGNTSSLIDPKTISVSSTVYSYSAGTASVPVLEYYLTNNRFVTLAKYEQEHLLLGFWLQRWNNSYVVAFQTGMTGNRGATTHIKPLLPLGRPIVK
ncbi:MAG: hypothetical protein WC511_02955 [Candidatus Pacearchaeota archaeon]